MNRRERELERIMKRKGSLDNSNFANRTLIISWTLREPIKKLILPHSIFKNFMRVDFLNRILIVFFI